MAQLARRHRPRPTPRPIPMVGPERLALDCLPDAASLASDGALGLPLKIFSGVLKKCLTLITGMNLDPDADIGPGFYIPHIGPLQITGGAQIGADCAAHAVVTIGHGSKPGVPNIGDHVMIGCHACILGPVTIGDRTRIGAGAVVLHDVPPDATAVGIPAKPIMKAADTRTAPASTPPK